MPLSDYALDNLCAPHLSKLTECGALEIGDVPFNLGTAVLSFLLRVRYDEPINRFAINLVRRTDHAIFEYQQGRRLLSEYVTSLKSGPRRVDIILRSICHFEQCILNLYLAVEIWQKVSKRGDYYKKGQRKVEERLYDTFINIKHFPQIGQKDASAVTPIWLTNSGIGSLRTQISWQELKAALGTLVLISEDLMEPANREGEP
jgi:hypothetical protein